ncbi:multidrug effflux MFS transporter [Amylibacter sp.]|nr:multidrug effflux MFS transporter [Amylibacter sp.]RZO39865.1 MAG: Bcr/CflA family efflux MFS transporter [Paracoccaceae bacterium]
MAKFPKPVFLNRETQPSMLMLVLLASISALAMNSFLPSLPNMAEHFGSSTALMGLSVGVYLGTSAIFQILVGPLSDRIGRRTVSLWALIIFSVVSISCVYAPNTFVFMVLRALQAIAACTFVVARAIVRDTTETQASGSKIAYISMGTAICPMFGPALGGLLDGWFGWEANFWFIGGLGIFILLIAYFDLGETVPENTQGFRQQFSEYPELLLSRRFWGYCLASAFGAGAFFAYLGGGPFVGSIVYNLSPEMLGLYFGAPAIGYFFGNFLSGRFTILFGIDAMILWGLWIIFSGLSLSMVCSYFGYGTVETFFGFMIFVGLGNGLTIPNATAGMLSVRPHLAGTASGLGGAMMIAIGAALSTLAGAFLIPGSNEMPLLMLMWFSSLSGVAVIIYVRQRNKRLKKLSNAGAP